jgi:predicted DNA-binding transcriptional regulator AlpA
MELLQHAESLWTVRQTSAWLSMSEQALRCMLRRNQIPNDVVVRIGRRVRFRSAALRAWVDRCKTA